MPGLIKSAPMFFIPVLAYFIMGPDIRNEFSINMIQLIGFLVVALIELVVYIVFLQKAGKKQYSYWKCFVFGMIAQAVLTMLFVFILLGGSLFAEPLYQAEAFVNI
jgi:hypothetical protein